jgi:hypothetical protein
MNPQRIRPRVAPGGRVAVRLNPAQRDLFVGSSLTPRNLVYALRQAPVREGKLSVRVRRAELEAMIAAAAAAPDTGRREEQELAALERYLEGLEDRFLEDTAPKKEEDAGADVLIAAGEDDRRRAGMSEE